ncbi:MAG TPA: DNA polymerase Y family protein [Terriglobales bacterium]
MPFACIFVPDFSAQAIVRAQPELRLQAVAVIAGNPPLEKVVSINENARHADVSIGMTKLQAELCEEVRWRDRSELQESAAHSALLDCAQAFSPRVEDAAPDAVLLDLSGLEKLFGPLPKIAREIFRRASQMGLETNVAVASTLESALLAAHGFSGVTVVPAMKEAQCLGSLPVEVLFADEADAKEAEEFLQTFHRWGIRKLRDFAALPEVDLSERLGQRGLELQRKARGIGARTLVPGEAPLKFEEVQELEFPLVLLEPLAFVLNRMLEQLCARLEARALAAQELRLQLTLENGRQFDPSLARFERTIHLPVPLLNPQTFLKLLQLDLKAHPPGAPVVKVLLRIEPAKPRPGQNGLFLPSSPEPEKLELTLARIAAVVGEGRAGSPALLDSHRREAFEMRRFTPSTVAFWRVALRSPAASRPRSIEVMETNRNSRAQELVTALRIFRPPLGVSVRCENGKPCHISCNKGKEFSSKVLWAAGPWRSSGDWWEHDAWLRDEWDIAMEKNGGVALYRLVHDLLNGKWMLEGSYD